MIRLAVVAVVCASVAARASPDGGVTFDVQRGDLIVGNRLERVVGGCYLNDAKCIGVARELVTLRAENASLKSSAVPPPAWVVTLLLVSMAAGFGAAFLVPR